MFAWGKDTTGQISYRFNQQGFRNDRDYDWVPEYAFFGNSIIFGVGVPQTQILCSHFANSHNYGLADQYLNQHSVYNLREFLKSDMYNRDTKIVFFWVDRGQEKVNDQLQQVIAMRPDILNISSGVKRPGAINLMPAIDSDVSGTHPGCKTHKIWARTIQQLFARA